MVSLFNLLHHWWPQSHFCLHSLTLHHSQMNHRHPRSKWAQSRERCKILTMLELLSPFSDLLDATQTGTQFVVLHKQSVDAVKRNNNGSGWPVEVSPASGLGGRGAVCEMNMSLFLMVLWVICATADVPPKPTLWLRRHVVLKQKGSYFFEVLCERSSREVLIKLINFEKCHTRLVARCEFHQTMSPLPW